MFGARRGTRLGTPKRGCAKAAPALGMCRAGFATALLALWPSLASAQDAQLQGTIKDLSGAIVPGASVTIVAPATGARRTLTTDAGGHYVFSFLGAGAYDITAELSGFQPVVRSGITLDSGSRVTLDLVLRPA